MPVPFPALVRRRAGLTLAAMAQAMLAILLVMTVAGGATAQTRIKDIVNVEGVRDNLLVGYGLVVGLNGTGDTLNNAPFTQQSLIGMLERLGVNTRDSLGNLNTANVAAVLVTATLPPFTRQGSRIDVTISALGNATSLLGGTLLVTPMLGADGEVYAVSQGSLVVAGFSAQGNDPPPLKWSDLKYVLWHQGGSKCRGRDTSRKRLSRSCGRLTFWSRRVRALRMRFVRSA